MRKIENEFGMKKRSKVLIAAVFAILSTVVVVACWRIYGSLQNQIEEVVKSNMANMNGRTGVIVSKELEGKQQIMKLLADELYGEPLGSVQDILDDLEPHVEEQGFYNMGVLLEDGTCYTTLNEVLDLSKYDYYKRSFQGKSVITETFPFEQTEGYANIFTVPVYVDGKVAYVLTACIRSENLAKMLDVSSRFDGVRTLVLNEKGKNIVGMTGDDDEEYWQISKIIDENLDLVPGKESYYSFYYKGKEYVAYVSSISVNNWYLMSIFDKDRVFASVEVVEQNMQFIVVILLGAVGSACACLVYMFQKYQKQVFNAIFIDGLLHEKNYEYLALLFKNQEKEEKQSLIAMDIDNFNMVNVAYGVEAGDELLHYISRTFQEELPEAGVYRKHSDNFAATIRGNAEEAKQKINKLLRRFEKDISEGKVVPFTMSVGICEAKESKELNTLYNNAIIARNRAKNSMGSKVIVYDDEFKQQQLNNLDMEASFERAIQNKEFQVYYQPKFDMRTREVTGSEALVRWIRPESGMISPAQFIPCFEESGKIVLLDGYIVEQVCCQMNEMRSEGIDVKKVSINLSRVNLKTPIYIIEKIKESIKTFRIDPSKLSFELTESAFCEDKRAVGQIVDALHKMGCQVDMDDYGTGMSGLQSLANTDFDTVKLDRSFIADINDIKMKEIVISAIELFSRLKITLIVEGVETEDQEAFLLQNNCIFAQGYLYSRPIDRQEYQNLLQKDA